MFQDGKTSVGLWGTQTIMRPDESLPIKFEKADRTQLITMSLTFLHSTGFFGGGWYPTKIVKKNSGYNFLATGQAKRTNICLLEGSVRFRDGACSRHKHSLVVTEGLSSNRLS